MPPNNKKSDSAQSGAVFVHSWAHGHSVGLNLLPTPHHIITHNITYTVPQHTPAPSSPSPKTSRKVIYFHSIFTSFPLSCLSSTSLFLRLFLEIEGGLHLHGPVELLHERAGVDGGRGHVVLLAPRDGDARVQVVDLGRAQRHRLELLLHLDLQLELGQALLQRRDLALVLVVLLLFHGAQLLVHRLLLVVQLLHLRVVRLAHALLVIAQHRHLLVGGVVRRLLHDQRAVGVRLLKQLVEDEGGVVRAEHLDGQARHQALQVLVHLGGVDLVEDVVVRLLALAELLQRGVHQRVHLVLLQVADGVLTQEVQLEGAGRAEVQVPHAQRAHPHRVRQVLVLLAARTQRQLVHQVRGDRELLLQLRAGLHLLQVVAADGVHRQLQLARLLVLLDVRLSFDGGRGAELHVLPVLGVDGVVPAGQPRDGVVVDHPLPLVAGGGHGHLGLLADVDDDVLRRDALLDAPHLGVLATPAEQPRGLHAVVAHLLPPPVDGGPAVVFLQRVLLHLHFLLFVVGDVLLLLALLQVPHVDLREVALREVLDVLVGAVL
mmetsp:Transcript_16304/g.39842  ORF Transcript_16304/g.39842 Transcript_16304/m.39842 type:complete len:546 (+) Transcript_16304:388-2025(+)